MNPTRILLAGLVLVTGSLAFHQWRMERAMDRWRAGDVGDRSAARNAQAAAPVDDTQAEVDRLKAQLDSAEARLAAARTHIAQLDDRLRQLESGPPRRQISFVETPGARSAVVPGDLMGGVTTAVKRAWGPEQAAGPPDTLQAGDISTAWASREPDGGEEWLRFDYERAVDIAEVRVRETHNPGAISKVTAFLATGAEMILWEGTEPPSQAPVEMSFQVPSTTLAKTIKIYLDTTRVPGWNEIDAVAILARDGSIQWARQVTASSSYAQRNPPRGLEVF